MHGLFLLKIPICYYYQQQEGVPQQNVAEICVILGTFLIVSVTLTLGLPSFLLVSTLCRFQVSTLSFFTNAPIIAITLSSQNGDFENKL